MAMAWPPLGLAIPRGSATRFLACAFLLALASALRALLRGPGLRAERPAGWPPAADAAADADAQEFAGDGCAPVLAATALPAEQRKHWRRRPRALPLPEAPWKRAAERIFCWAISRGEPTAPVMRHQLQLCGGFVILSNISDWREGTVKLFNGSMEVSRVVTGKGQYANTTLMFAKAWNYVACICTAGEYDWFVKIDTDTYLRPHFLAKALAALRLNTSEALGFGMLAGTASRLRMYGGMVVLSEGAVHGTPPFFRHGLRLTRRADHINRTWVWCEDLWTGVSLAHVGGRILKMETPDGCQFAALGPQRRNLIFSGRRVRPSVFEPPREGSGASAGACQGLHNVAGIHPIKNPETMTQLREHDPNF